MSKSNEFYEIRTNQSSTGYGYFRSLENAKAFLAKKKSQIRGACPSTMAADGMSFYFDTGGWACVSVKWFIRTHPFKDA